MTSRKSCLLIDDDPDDQMLFSIAIEKLNSTTLCVTADNGLQAIRQLQQDPSFVPDLIFLDLHLPGLSGIDFLIKIKEDPRFARIPVVIYTTSSSQRDIARAKEHGAADFITKSHDIVDLMKKLNELFTGKTIPETPESNLKVSFRRPKT